MKNNRVYPSETRLPLRNIMEKKVPQAGASLGGWQQYRLGL